MCLVENKEKCKKCRQIVANCTITWMNECMRALKLIAKVTSRM